MKRPPVWMVKLAAVLDCHVRDKVFSVSQLRFNFICLKQRSVLN